MTDVVRVNEDAAVPGAGVDWSSLSSSSASSLSLSLSLFRSWSASASASASLSSPLGFRWSWGEFVEDSSAVTAARVSGVLAGVDSSEGAAGTGSGEEPAVLEGSMVRGEDEKKIRRR